MWGDTLHYDNGTKVSGLHTHTSKHHGVTLVDSEVCTHQYIKILTVCLCVTEVGCSWGGTRL